jgi:hypothetical protein
MSLRPIHTAIKLLSHMPVGSVWRFDQSYRGAWAFIGPRWELVDHASGFTQAYMSPVIAPDGEAKALLLSVCDINRERIGEELVEGLRVYPGKRSIDTADRLCAAYCDLVTAIEMGGWSKLLKADLRSFTGRQLALR